MAASLPIGRHVRRKISRGRCPSCTRWLGKSFSRRKRSGTRVWCPQMITLSHTLTGWFNEASHKLPYGKFSILFWYRAFHILTLFYILKVPVFPSERGAEKTVRCQAVCQTASLGWKDQVDQQLILWDGADDVSRRRPAQRRHEGSNVPFQISSTQHLPQDLGKVLLRARSDQRPAPGGTSISSFFRTNG